MTVQVTVYSKPNCPQCTQTKKRLEKLEIPFTEESVLDHLEEFKQRGHLAAPVVIVTDEGYIHGGVHLPMDEWSGHRDSNINALKRYIDSDNEWEGIWND